MNVAVLMTDRQIILAYDELQAMRESVPNKKPDIFDTDLREVFRK